MRKGDIHESDVSEVLHRSGVPALISSLVLRSQNLGQIDVAYLEKNKQKAWVLKIIETKTSMMPSRAQMARLLKTQDYLSRVLDIESKLEVKFCQKADPSLFF